MLFVPFGHVSFKFSIFVVFVLSFWSVGDMAHRGTVWSFVLVVIQHRTRRETCRNAVPTWEDDE